MKNSKFSTELIITIIATSLVSSLFVSTLGGNSLVYPTPSLSQSIQQNQQDLQSIINKEVQQTITDTINDINNSNSASDQTNNSQTQNNTSLAPFQQKASVIDNMPSQKIRVGDIDIAYKILGDGNRTMILITGLGATMDMWSPYLLNNLTDAPNDYRVIIFDNRGAGESTIGTKEFSFSQFANDTLGLLDALNIKKADILGASIGGSIALELSTLNPNRVNNLIIYESSCGGKDSLPPSLDVIQTFSNSSLSPQERGQKSISLAFPEQWLKLNPNVMDFLPIPKESVSPDVIQKQLTALEEWSGNCQKLENITSPTLAIVGTEDEFTPAENSVMIAEKIPGAWLVQIRDAGHGLMYQYPATFIEIVETFLNVTDNKMR